MQLSLLELLATATGFNPATGQDLFVTKMISQKAGKALAHGLPLLPLLVLAKHAGPPKVKGLARALACRGLEDSAGLRGSWEEAAEGCGGICGEAAVWIDMLPETAEGGRCGYIQSW